MKKILLLSLSLFLVGCKQPTTTVESTPTVEAETVTTFSLHETTYITREESFTINDKFIYGTFYTPDTDTPYPTVIMAHGYGGSSQDLAIFADWFASQGIACYTFDFCGGGATKSTGTMLDMSALTELEDYDAVISHIQSLPEVDTNHLWLMGQSQGGLVSTMIASQRQAELEGLLLIYPAFAIPDMTREMFPDPERIPNKAPMFYGTVSRKYFLDAQSVDIYALLETITLPTFISHGDQDTLIPYQSAVQGCQSLQNCSLYTVEGASHGYIEPVAKDVNDRMLEFMVNTMNSGN